MKLVAYAEASSGINPGHIAIGQEEHAACAEHYGFRFDFADLPLEYRNAERWRDYLFANSVPGHVVDETDYVNLLLKSGRDYYSKEADSSKLLTAALPPVEGWRNYANYSFNPDNHTSSHAPCHNCVTWAISIANQVVDAFFSSVPQGRIRHIIQQMSKVNAVHRGDRL